MLTVLITLVVTPGSLFAALAIVLIILQRWETGNALITDVVSRRNGLRDPSLTTQPEEGSRWPRAIECRIFTEDPNRGPARGRNG